MEFYTKEHVCEDCELHFGFQNGKHVLFTKSVHNGIGSA